MFGCDEITAACPVLTQKACHAGFDARNHEGRTAIRDCIRAATGDCEAAFYRCVWNLTL